MKTNVISNYRGIIRSKIIDLNKYIHTWDNGIYEIKIPVKNKFISNLPPNKIEFSNNEYVGLTPSAFLRLYKNKGNDIRVENDLIKFTGKEASNDNFLTGILEIVSDGELTIQKFHRLPDGSLWQRSYTKSTNTWTSWASEIPSYVLPNDLIDTRKRQDMIGPQNRMNKDTNMNIDDYYIDAYTGKNKKVRRNNYMGAYRAKDGSDVNKYNSFNIYNKLKGTLTDLEVVSTIDQTILDSEMIGGKAKPVDIDKSKYGNNFFNGVGLSNYNYITKSEYNKKLTDLFNTQARDGMSNEEVVKLNKRKALMQKFRLKNNMGTKSTSSEGNLIIADTKFELENFMVYGSGEDSINFANFDTIETLIPDSKNKKYKDYVNTVSNLNLGQDMNFYNYSSGFLSISMGTVYVFNAQQSSDNFVFAPEVKSKFYPFTYDEDIYSTQIYLKGQIVPKNKFYIGESNGTKTYVKGNSLIWDNVTNASEMIKVINSDSNMQPSIRPNSNDKFPSFWYLTNLVRSIKIKIYVKEKKTKRVGSTDHVYYNIKFTDEYIIIPYEYVNDKFVPIKIFGLYFDKTKDNNQIEFGGFTYTYKKGNDPLKDIIEIKNVKVLDNIGYNTKKLSTFGFNDYEIDFEVVEL